MLAEQYSKVGNKKQNTFFDILNQLLCSILGNRVTDLRIFVGSSIVKIIHVLSSECTQCIASLFLVQQLTSNLSLLDLSRAGASQAYNLTI